MVKLESIMDKNKKLKRSSPRHSANIFSRFIFWWLKSLLWRIKNNNFKANDLYDILQTNKSEFLDNKLDVAWKKELEFDVERPNLWKALFRTFKWYFVQHIICLLTIYVIRTVQPLIASSFIKHFEASSMTSTARAYAYAGAFVTTLALHTACAHHLRFQQQENGMRLRTACSSLIYRKITRLPCLSTNQSTKDLIIDLLTKDAANLEQFFVYVHHIWITPLQTAVIIYLMYSDIGIASLVGVLSILIQGLPMQAYCNRITARLNSKIIGWTNERILLTNEVVRRIRTTKIYCWEKPVEKLIYLTRRYEIDILKITSYLKALNLASCTLNEHTPLFLTILVYVLIKNTLSAHVVFTTILYLLVLQETIIFMCPKAVASAVETNVSIKRIEKFLLDEEIEPNILLSMLSNDKSSISIKNVNASWTKDKNINVLENINLWIPPKKLYIITGPVGSGKSSLLKLIMGELLPHEGEVSVNGCISYASQNPWLFPGTLKNNILCNEFYDEEYYNEITRVCGLAQIFDALPSGDETIVGNENVILNVEQRARVNLARALYKDADIYLLDDPFTLLGYEMYKECINKVLNNKTCIIVLSKRLQILEDINEIIFLNNGKIEFQGTFSSYKIEFQGTFSSYEKSDHFNQIRSVESQRNSIEILNVNKILKSNKVLDSSIQKNEEEEPAETKELLTKESASKYLFWKYLRASGSDFILYFLILIFTLAQLSTSGSDFWIAYWTNHEEMHLNYISQFSNNSVITEEKIKNDTGSEKIKTSQFFDLDLSLYFYGSLILGIILISIIKNILFFKVCLSANEKIHNNMFARLIRAPMQFFYTNPSEKIIDQFSNDIGQLDEILPKALLDIFQILFTVIGATLLLIIVNYWMILPILLITYLYLKLHKFYLSTIQKLKQLEYDVKCQSLSHVESAMSGLPTLRSSRAQKLVIKAFSMSQDTHTSAYSLLVATSAAFGFWIEALTTAFAALLVCGFVPLGRANVAAAYVGLAIKELVLLGKLALLGINYSKEVIGQKANLEKAFKYTELQQEIENSSKKSEKQLKSWPSKGEIKFNNVYVKYSNTNEPVLGNLNFTIKAGSKVAVIEIDDSKKSSLTAALYRLAEIEGTLTIDDVNVKTVDLQDLRERIAFVSPELAFYTDTPRDNLDPLHEYDDAELWSALQDVKLNRSFVSLDHSCSDLSPGRRKLLSLARAIIRKSKILLVDETIADEDDTKDLFQQILKSEFKNSTILTVIRKSRITRNLSCDKVLLLTDDGNTIEYECSNNGLLELNDDFFSKVVNRTLTETVLHIDDIKSNENE